MHRWLLLPLCLTVICILLASFPLAKERKERELLPIIYAAAQEFDVPVATVLAVIRTESGFREDAVSAAGAMGLMQLLPETFLWISEEKLCERYEIRRITEPNVNIRYGTYYLSYLYRRFGDWSVALAAYNAGPGNVRKYGGIPPFKETRAFIYKVKKESSAMKADPTINAHFPKEEESIEIVEETL